MINKKLQGCPEKVRKTGGEWYDFMNGHKYEGEQEILIECPLDKLPVFAKGGSIIPMQTIVQSTSEKPSDTLFVHVYYGSKGSVYNYYEDDGLTYSYETGGFLESAMTFNPSARKINFESLSGKSYQSKFKIISVILHGFEPLAQQLKLNGKGVEPTETKIDLYNSIKPTDPLWFDSRSMKQKVLVIANLNAGNKNEISW